MKKTVFEYRDYKKYLADWIESRPGQGRGERSRIAQALNCHLAYVSQVLGGGAQFSPEQAEMLNRHLGHDSEETDFFMLLVSLGRAGTKALEAYYSKLIQQTLERRAVLKNRLNYQKTLSKEDQATYYSAWYYAAIHLLLGVPELQTKKALSEYLGLSLQRVSQVLDFLVGVGLAQEEGNRYRIGATSIHLGNDSPLISKHHSNWRMQALQSLERERPEELHYSSVVTMSRADLEKIRSILVGAIEQVRGVVRESKEEALFCYSLDLFEVGE